LRSALRSSRFILCFSVRSSSFISAISPSQRTRSPVGRQGETGLTRRGNRCGRRRRGTSAYQSPSFPRGQ
jgi:hypothetical protein